MRKAIWILLLMVVAPPMWAQTVSPVISEYGKRAEGQFTLTNNTFVPEAATVEALSFTADEHGTAAYRALDPGVTVQLSETSARLGPKASHTFQYRVTCAAMPCAVVLFSTLTGLQTVEGIKLNIHLPHSVYVCEKAKACRANMRRAWGVAD